MVRPRLDTTSIGGLTPQLLVAEDLLGDGHGRPCLRPACVERQMSDGLDELSLSGAGFLSEGQVVAELVGVAW
jgi:hypothetical protein